MLFLQDSYDFFPRKLDYIVIVFVLRAQSTGFLRDLPTHAYTVHLAPLVMLGSIFVVFVPYALFI